MTTKERIKSVALTLFAKKGYYGTTMNEIANGVGIKKPSLYAHFKGKDELFFEVYNDLEKKYVEVMDRIFNESKDMDIQDKLYYIFVQYITHYLRNPELQAFWNQIILFTPPNLHDKFFSRVKSCELVVQQRIEKILEEGMRRGLIRSDDTKKMTMSFISMREGLLNWMMVIPELKEEYIEMFWKDFWLGIKGEGAKIKKQYNLAPDRAYKGICSLVFNRELF